MYVSATFYKLGTTGHMNQIDNSKHDHKLVECDGSHAKLVLPVTMDAEIDFKSGTVIMTKLIWHSRNLIGESVV